MVRRIVVGLDGSEYSRTALKLACTRTRITGGRVIGVGVIDLPGISRLEIGAPLGATYYAEKAVETRLAEVRQKMNQYIAEFKSTCEEFGVDYAVRSHEGVPFKEIVEEAHFADLIYIGIKTFYHFGPQSKPGDTIRRILELAPCPVVAVPKNVEFPQQVLIALDDSKESARGLREFVDLYEEKGLFGDMTFFLVSAGEPDASLQRLHRQALEYLKTHDLEATSIIRPGKPSTVLLEEAKSRMPCGIVMGAYGKTGISSFFYGSTTRRIVEDGTVLLMVTH